MVTMEDAAQIRDVAQRHAFAFNNGLSHRDFFDVDKRIKSEEFTLLRDRCEKGHSILEIGCYTGLNLLGLGTLGFTSLTGVDFVRGALEWLEYRAHELKIPIRTFCLQFPEQLQHQPGVEFDRIICFDVLEHQLNVGSFLKGIKPFLKPNGQLLILVPEGREYYDCGHVAFFPDAVCLKNVLDYYFDVTEMIRLDCKKLFAVCKRRN